MPIKQTEEAPKGHTTKIESMFDGYVTRVCIINRALSDEEIDRIFNETKELFVKPTLWQRVKRLWKKIKRDYARY